MPWVPRDLYDLMVDSLRVSRGLVASPSEAKPSLGSEAPPEAQRTPNPPAVGSSSAAPADQPTVTLPRRVLDACEQFAFGNPAEAVANVQRALQMQAQHTPERDIVAAIRAGADTSALFIG